MHGSAQGLTRKNNFLVSLPCTFIRDEPVISRSRASFLIPVKLAASIALSASQQQGMEIPACLSQISAFTLEQNGADKQPASQNPLDLTFQVIARDAYAEATFEHEMNRDPTSKKTRVEYKREFRLTLNGFDFTEDCQPKLTSSTPIPLDAFIKGLMADIRQHGNPESQLLLRPLQFALEDHKEPINFNVVLDLSDAPSL